MYKKIIFLIILALYNCYIFSQQIPLPPASKSPRYQYFPSQIIDPTTGKLFENNYPDIKGFPFFTEDWKYALIKLTDGRTLDVIKTRLDLYASELYFKTNNSVEMVFDTGYVKEMDIYDSLETKNIIYRFQAGFPKIDDQNQNTYYQVISQGNVTLLKLIRKKISVNKNDLSGEVEKQFDAYEDYYVFSNNQMKRLKKEKDFILETLSEKKDKIEEFVKQHSINFKNIKDIIILFNFYNSLKPIAF